MEYVNQFLTCLNDGLLRNETIFKHFILKKNTNGYDAEKKNVF